MQLYFKNYCSLTEKEAKEVLRQRNSPECRKQMFTSEVISEREHFDFIHKLSQRKDCAYWAAIVNGKIVGTNSLQHIQNGEAEPGGYVVDMGMGIGAVTAYHALNHYFSTLGLRRLIIRVLKENQPAIAMNLQLGYSVVPEHTIHIDDKVFCGMELSAESWKVRQPRLQRVVNHTFPAKHVIWEDAAINK